MNILCAEQHKPKQWFLQIIEIDKMETTQLQGTFKMIVVYQQARLCNELLRKVRKNWKEMIADAKPCWIQKHDSVIRIMDWPAHLPTKVWIVLHTKVRPQKTAAFSGSQRIFKRAIIVHQCNTSVIAQRVEVKPLCIIYVEERGFGDTKFPIFF